MWHLRDRVKGSIKDGGGGGLGGQRSGEVCRKKKFVLLGWVGVGGGFFDGRGLYRNWMQSVHCHPSGLNVKLVRLRLVCIKSGRRRKKEFPIRSKLLLTRGVSQSLLAWWY